MSLQSDVGKEILDICADGPKKPSEIEKEVNERFEDEDFGDLIDIIEEEIERLERQGKIFKQDEETFRTLED